MSAAALISGLKCAPLIGPNNMISVARPATVASVFASSAIASFPPDNRSAMMPEPTTRREQQVPSASTESALRIIRRPRR